ncbi:MAG: hypothetical protein KC492_36155, partial [Myxococcales bacterium]|nr:hypothetical protein [Myxococcales bacterium]
ARVFEVDLMLDDRIEDYGNTATAVGLYGFLKGCAAPGSNCDTPTTAANVRSYNNSISSARYLAYQFATNSTSAVVSFAHNTVTDTLCIAGSNDPAVALQADLQGNILTPTRAATCIDDELPQATSVSFVGKLNHWGDTTVPVDDSMGVNGALNLDSVGRPNSTSTACSGTSRLPAPVDVDFLGLTRSDPTAFGAFECP